MMKGREPVTESDRPLGFESPAPGSPLSPESDSPPPPPPPEDYAYSSYSETSKVPPPPDHPPPTKTTLPPSKADDGIENAVEEIVDQVVASAVSNTESKNSSKAKEDPVAEPTSKPSVTPKVLTVDDVKRMIEKCKWEVETKGPAAATAALQVGMVYCHGPYGIERNAKLAVKYLEYGLEHGAFDANAAFQLGMIYNSGADGIEPDPARAVTWWSVAAELGNAVGMFNLAVMKMNGSGCDMDPIGAMALFAKAQMKNPRLRMPAMTQEMLAERIAVAGKQNKERAISRMTPEEREARREAALQDVRYVAYGTGALAALTVGLFAFRHWWRNTL